MDDSRTRDEQLAEFTGAARAAFGIRASQLDARAMEAEEAGDESAAAEFRARAEAERSQGQAFMPDTDIFDRARRFDGPTADRVASGALSADAATRLEQTRQLLDSVSTTSPEAVAEQREEQGSLETLNDILERAAYREAELQIARADAEIAELQSGQSGADPVEQATANIERRAALRTDELDRASMTPETIGAIVDSAPTAIGPRATSAMSFARSVSPPALSRMRFASL